jgi:hypothetical protein
VAWSVSATGPTEANPAQGPRQTRAIVQDRLKTLHHELDAGIQARPSYTLRRAADGWLLQGLDGRSAKSINMNQKVLAPILVAIGARSWHRLLRDYFADL